MIPQPNTPLSSVNGAPGQYYDYIIAGAGASGLSLLLRMIASGTFTKKKILLVDKDSKNINDRTWCFWEKGEGFFESIVYKTWENLIFRSDGFEKKYRVQPYRYKMIRGIDFYKHAFDIIKRQENITIRFGEVNAMHSDELATWLELDQERIHCGYIFNSIQMEKPVLRPAEHLLLQHFKGWVIETASPIFDVGTATLMDFTVSQEKGTAFVYVMPLSTQRALVEYTLFTERLLERAAYDAALEQYLQGACPGGFTVKEEEFGIIPMTDHLFPGRSGNIIFIGTAGGQTKASSGYTFCFIQKHSEIIVQNLIRNESSFHLPPVPGRFHFYDSVLLNVLATRKLPGKTVFTELFSKNPIHRIFAFLDNESTLLQELQLVSTLPVRPFLQAAWEKLRN